MADFGSGRYLEFRVIPREPSARARSSSVALTRMLSMISCHEKDGIRDRVNSGSSGD